MLSAKPTAIIGHVMRAKALQNAKNAPCERPPLLRPAQEQRRAVPEEDEDPDRGDRADGGRERAAQPGQGEARVEVLAVGLLEARALALLEREAAHDAHAREVRLQHVAHAPERRPGSARMRTYMPRETGAR